MSYLVSYATSSEADFETMQWIFVMEPGFRVFAGRCAIMPAEQFDRLLAQRDELLRLIKEARATLEVWKDVAPAVSLCADIDVAIAKAAREPT